MKKGDIKVGQVVRVKWEDSYTCNGGDSWHDPTSKEWKEVYKARTQLITVGKVVVLSKSTVTLAQSWGEGRDVSNTFCIPLGAILSVKKL